jgi:acylphosphatase
MPEKPARASLHALVRGSVQGVFYRMFVVREAQSLGLCGTVRNLPDGRVEAIAEGEKQMLDRLILRLRKGPPSAEVHEVQVDWDEYHHDYDDFQIDYR